MSTVKHLYLDATEAYWSGLRTGIQRVVRSLADRRAMISERTGYACTPTVCDRRAILDASTLLAASQDSQALPANQRARRSLARPVRWALKRVFPVTSPVFRALQAAWRGLLFPYTYLASAKARAWEREQTRIAFAPGDAFVLCDAFWGRHGQRSVKAAARAAAQGIPVVLLIYDLFPLTRPELFDDETAALFKRHFPRVLRACCGILTISRAMAEEVRGYVRAHHPEAGTLPVEAFHLGQDIQQPATQPALPVRPLIAELTAGRRFYLAVGTLEPRKGYAFLLDAFEQRWRRDPTLSLCIVGRIGWKCRAELSRIRRSPHLNARLFFFNDASDSELAQLYTHTQAVVLPSVAEGFGLPLVEAMSAGAPVIANDIPVFREIGGDYPLYYGQTGERLNDAIDEMERRLASGWRPTPKSWLTWDDATVEFADALMRILNRAPPNERTG
jgi:alpha-1,2-rhamnosyltransferase